MRSGVSTLKDGQVGPTRPVHLRGLWRGRGKRKNQGLRDYSTEFFVRPSHVGRDGWSGVPGRVGRTHPGEPGVMWNRCLFPDLSPDKHTSLVRTRDQDMEGIHGVRSYVVGKRVNKSSINNL